MKYRFHREEIFAILDDFNWFFHRFSAKKKLISKNNFKVKKETPRPKTNHLGQKNKKKKKPSRFKKNLVGKKSGVHIPERVKFRQIK